MNRKVPVFATWLLERFGVKRQNEALIGDLAEEYQAGKSWAWYWWQALVAIWVTAVRDVRAHKGLALRAVAIGWILGRAFSWLDQHMIFPFLIAPYYDGHWSQSLIRVIALRYSLPSLLIGWLVARAHRGYPAVMALTVAASLPFTGMAFHIYNSVDFSPTFGIYFSQNIFDIYISHPAYIFAWWAQNMVLILAGGLLVRPKIGPEQPPATIAHGMI